MKKLLETLYILTPDSYVYHRNENICVSIGGSEKVSIPISHIHSVVFFGKNTMSTSLLGFCGNNDVTITFLDQFGNFEGRVCGKVSGNVLLRKRQYECFWTVKSSRCHSHLEKSLFLLATMCR